MFGFQIAVGYRNRLDVNVCSIQKGHLQQSVSLSKFIKVDVEKERH